MLTPAPAGELIDIGGYRLHIDCRGEGRPPDVLVAGSGDFSFDWSLVLPQVARFTRVCSYDRAGLAWSDLGPPPRTMRQEAHELHLLLQRAAIKPPFVLVGHSLGGLIVRVYAAMYPEEVGGIVLIEPTHEDTVLLLNGKLVRVRETATQRAIPPVQDMQSSPPGAPSPEEIENFRKFQKLVGPPKIEPPFDKLRLHIQRLRLWALAHPKLSAAGGNFFAEELQQIYTHDRHVKHPLGGIPLFVLFSDAPTGDPPPGIAAEEWKRVTEEKIQQKRELAGLSRNGRAVVDNKSGHHIQLDNPHLVTAQIREVAEEARHRRWRSSAGNE